MVKDRWQANRNPFTPKEVKGTKAGRRPSIKRLVDLLDSEDPAFGRIASVLTDMVSAGVEIDEAAIAIAVKLGKQHLAADAQTEAAIAARKTSSAPLRLWPEENARASIVYYIRRGDLIKIGTTTNPCNRFKDLLPDEILAWEPGGRHEEMLRHRRFRHLRQGQGEYFKTGPDLIKHCKAIREIHGEPDPAWRTTNNITLSVRGRRPELPRALPLPDSSVLVNAIEASRMLDINKNTIASWVHRQLLKPVDRDEKNRPVYFLDHVRFLRDQSKAYRDTA